MQVYGTAGFQGCVPKLHPKVHCFYHVPTLGHGNSPLYLDKYAQDLEFGMTRNTDTVPNVFVANVSNQMMMVNFFFVT